MEYSVPKRMYLLLITLTSVCGFFLLFTTTSVSVFDVAISMLSLPLIYHLYDTFGMRIPQNIRGPYILLLCFVILQCFALIFLPATNTIYFVTTLYCIVLFGIGIVLRKNDFTTYFLQGYKVSAVFFAIIGTTIWHGFNNTSIAQMLIQDNRFLGLTSDPNILASLLISPLFLFAVDCLERNSTRRNIFPYLFAFLCIAYTLYLTGSRGAYIGCMVGSIILFIKIVHTHAHEMRRWIPRMLLCICVVLILLIMGTKSELFELRYKASILPRIEIYSWAIDNIKERTFYELMRGTGTGSFERFEPEGRSAHNTYLRLLHEDGVLGISVWTLFLLFYFSMRRNTEMTLQKTALFASCVAIMVHALFIDTLHFRHFWILLGLL